MARQVMHLSRLPKAHETCAEAQGVPFGLQHRRLKEAAAPNEKEPSHLEQRLLGDQL